MTVLVVLGCAVAAAAGLMLVVVGLVGVDLETDGVEDRGSVGDRLVRVDRLRLRVGLAVGAAILMWTVSGWPVAALLAALGGFGAPTMVGSQKRRKAAVARTEAIATWAEQMRDTISSAAGLQEAITTTSRVAPREIRPEVQALALGMRRTPLPALLRRFADAVNDPAGDQVAVALILASQRRGQNLSALLGDVAESARQEANMRMRTETSRAQSYSDAKAVTGIVLAVFALLLVTSRAYLAPFDSVLGQLVLAVVGSMWGVALYGLAKLSEVRRGPRILRLTDVDEALMAEGML